MQTLATWTERWSDHLFLTLIFVLLQIYVLRFFLLRKFDPEFRETLKGLDNDDRWTIYSCSLLGFFGLDDQLENMKAIRAAAPTSWVFTVRFNYYSSLVVFALMFISILPGLTERLGFQDLGLGDYGPNYRRLDGFKGMMVDHLLDHLAKIIHGPIEVKIVLLAFDALVIYLLTRLSRVKL